MNTFEMIWPDLVRQLKLGMSIDNWTAYRGYLGNTMKIAGVNDRYIEVEAPNAKTIQHVPKEDFRKVWKVWADYKAENFPRSEMREFTFFSKYIISILHWYEETSLQSK
jgi:hypothetical protein